MRYNGMRTLTQFLAGHQPGPGRGDLKLYWSEYHKLVTELAVDILGAEALVPTGREPSSRVPDRRRRRAELHATRGCRRSSTRAAGTIYAGTSQIQRNIIGEMVLGLPKEPRADSGKLGRAAGAPGLSRIGLAPARSWRCCAALASGRRRCASASRLVPGGLVAPAPVPARARRAYLRFRLQTQYGDARHRSRPTTWSSTSRGAGSGRSVAS